MCGMLIGRHSIVMHGDKFIACGLFHASPPTSYMGSLHLQHITDTVRRATGRVMLRRELSGSLPHTYHN